MTDFICPTCKRRFDDTDFEDQIECDNIRDTGECQACENDEDINDW